MMWWGIVDKNSNLVLSAFSLLPFSVHLNEAMTAAADVEGVDNASGGEIANSLYP